MGAGRLALGVLDSYLSRRDFITDHGYSVADVAVYGYTHLAAEGGFDLGRFAHVGRWMQRVQQSPAYESIGQLLKS